MCRLKELFFTLTESKQNVLLASGESIEAEGIEMVKVKTEYCQLELNNVLHVPELHSNFFIYK